MPQATHETKSPTVNTAITVDDADAMFDRYCKLDEKENGFINARTTWVLIFHGFLFGAIATSLQADAAWKWCIDLPFLGVVLALAIGQNVICLLGFFSACGGYLGLRAAEHELDRLHKWWFFVSTGQTIGERFAEQPYQTQFQHLPPTFTWRPSFWKASHAFIVLASAWGSILLIVLFAQRS